jgi:hypothetical protein
MCVYLFCKAIHLPPTETVGRRLLAQEVKSNLTVDLNDRAKRIYKSATDEHRGKQIGNDERNDLFLSKKVSMNYPSLSVAENCL